MANETTVIVGNGLQVALPLLPKVVRFPQFDGYAWDVARFTDDQLQAIGEAWTEALIKHAAERRKGA